MRNMTGYLHSYMLLCLQCERYDRILAWVYAIMFTLLTLIH